MSREPAVANQREKSANTWGWAILVMAVSIGGMVGVIWATQSWGLVASVGLGLLVFMLGIGGSTVALLAAGYDLD